MVDTKRFDDWFDKKFGDWFEKNWCRHIVETSVYRDGVKIRESRQSWLQIAGRKFFVRVKEKNVV